MGKTINQQPPFSGNALQNTYYILDQLFGSEYTTSKLSGEQLALACGFISFPTDTLTDADIGKLVMNKNGKAVVANRDTPRPAQAGQWTITVNAVFEKPTPTQVDFTFTGLPAQDDYIVLGLQRFVFKATPSNPYDIQIGSNVAGTITNATNIFNTTYPNQWTASNDGVNRVSVVFDAPLKAGLDNPLSDVAFGFYYGVQNPDQVDAVSSHINLNIPDFGNEQNIRKFNSHIFDYGGQGLSYYATGDHAIGAPYGTELFGVKWVTNINEQAANIANGINVNFAGKLQAIANNNIITVLALTEPTDGLAADITLGANAAAYISIVTGKFNIAANPDWIVEPVLGLLAAVREDMALINASNILQVNLSGNTNADVTDIGNNLDPNLVFNRILVPAANGTLETFSSMQSLNPGIKSDRWFSFHLGNENAFYALSSAAPGGQVLAMRGIPMFVMLSMGAQ